MKKWNLFCMIILLPLTFFGCNIPNQSAKQETSEYILTSAAETVSVELTQRASQITLTAKPTLPPTLSLAISPTNGTAQDPTVNVTTSTTSPAPCNMAKFLTDVTYPDDTEVPPGSTFIKTWRLKNAGTCSWNSDYELVYYQGERMNAPDAVPISAGTISPGESTEISVSLRAPTFSGTFQTSFLLRSPDGKIFGVGQHGDEEIFVRIKVNLPTLTPTKTNIPTSTSTSTPVSTIIALPDIQVNAIVLTPITPIQGQVVHIDITVLNTGTATTGSFKVKWWPGENYSDPACLWEITSITPGSSKELQCDYPGYPESYNSLTTKVFVDADNNIVENNEANNVALMNIQVLKP